LEYNFGFIFVLIEGNKTKTTKNLTERTFLGFMWMILGSGIQVALKIVILAVLARLVSPREFGIMGIAIIVMEFSKMFAHMGVGPAIVQRKELEHRHLTTGFTFSFFMGILFATILILIAPHLAAFFRMNELIQVLRVISLIFLIDSFTLIAQALLQRRMKFKIIASIEITSYTFGYGAVGIILAYSGFGVWALVGARLSQVALSTLLLVIAQPFPKKPGFEVNAFKELIFFGGGMTIAMSANFLANQGDKLVIGRILGAGALGIYGRAYQFMAMPASTFGNALDKAFFPAMAKVQEDQQKLAKAYLTGVSLIAIVALPLSLAIIILAPEIILVLLGPTWVEVIPPLQILAGILLFRMSCKMSASLARGTGAVYRRAWRQIVYAVLVLTGSYVGQFWGIQGVAFGVAVALIINFLMMAHLSLQLTNLSWLDVLIAHRNGIVIGLIVGIASYALTFLCRIYMIPDYLTLIIAGFGASISLLLTFIYSPRLIISEGIRDLYERLVIKRFKNG
jgi:PST family polysaccharide transporter